MRSMSSGAQISEHHSFLVWPWATSPSWDWISSSVKGEWHLPPPWRVVRSEQDNSCHVLVSAPTHGNYSSLLELNSAKFGFQLLFTLHPFSSFFFFSNYEMPLSPHHTDQLPKANFCLSFLPPPIKTHSQIKALPLLMSLSVFQFFGVSFSFLGYLFQGWQSLHCVRSLLPQEKSISVSMFLFPCSVFALLLLYIPLVQFKSHLIQKAFPTSPVFTGSSSRWPSGVLWTHRPAVHSGHWAKHGFFISLLLS